MISTDPNETERPTYEPVQVPNILAVGCREAVLNRCWTAAAKLSVMTRCASPLAAPTIAAARRPFAIVAPTELYSRCHQELDALARDVGAVVLPVDEDISTREIEAMLTGAIRLRFSAEGESLQSPLERRSPPAPDHPTNHPPAEPRSSRSAEIAIPPAPASIGAARAFAKGSSTSGRYSMVRSPMDPPPRSGIWEASQDSIDLAVDAAWG